MRVPSETALASGGDADFEVACLSFLRVHMWGCGTEATAASPRSSRWTPLADCSARSRAGPNLYNRDYELCQERKQRSNPLFSDLKSQEAWQDLHDGYNGLRVRRHPQTIPKVVWYNDSGNDHKMGHVLQVHALSTSSFSPVLIVYWFGDTRATTNVEVGRAMRKVDIGWRGLP